MLRSTPVNRRPQVQAGSNWQKSFATVALPFTFCIALFLIACMIVLSLIPTFVPNRSIPLSEQIVQEANLIRAAFSTNLANGSGLVVNNLESLARQLNEQLNLGNRIRSVASAQFFPPGSVVANKRRKRSMSQKQSPKLDGDDCVMLLVPNTALCGLATSCITDLVQQIRQAIQLLGSLLSLLFSFTNGLTFIVQMVFLGFFETIVTNPTTIPTTTTTSTTSITEATSTTTVSITEATSTTTVRTIFSSSESYFLGTGAFPRALAIARLNGDNIFDIVVTNAAADNVTILINDGAGDFIFEQSVPNDEGLSPFAVTAFDIDNDGDNDLAVANYQADSIGLLENLGGGIFSRLNTTSLDQGSSPRSLAPIDINGDGFVDFLVANSGGDTVTTFMNQGNKAFTLGSVLSTGIDSVPVHLMVKDLNNDQNLDFAVANSGTGTIGIFLSQGGGVFSQQVEYSTGSGSTPLSLAIGDLDNDGTQDIVVANSESDTVGVHFNEGSGTFAPQVEYSTGDGSTPSGIALADLNKDDFLDIIAAGYDSGSLLIFLNTGDGNFESAITVSTGEGSFPISVATEDLNNDGSIDAAVALFGADSVLVLLG